MTNTKELRKLIAEKGYKLKYVAQSLGLSPYGFQLKVDNKREFKTGEVAALCELLHIETLEEKEKIFFANNDDFKSSIA